MASYEQEVAEQAKDAVSRAEVTAKVKEKLADLVTSGKIDLEADAPSGNYRAFVAPVEKFTKFLVKAGKTKAIRDANSPTGQRDVSREGDIFVEFQDGIAVFNADDPIDMVKIAWCVDHAKICRDIDDPYTEAWAYMKELQQETSTAGKRLPESINLEGILRGDPNSGKVPHDAVGRARKQKDQMEGK